MRLKTFVILVVAAWVGWRFFGRGVESVYFAWEELIIFGVVILIVISAVWFVIYLARTREEREERLRKEAERKRTRVQPYQTPIMVLPPGYGAPQAPSEKPSQWIDLPADRFELLD